jgi:hypothetical protein
MAGYAAYARAEEKRASATLVVTARRNAARVSASIEAGAVSGATRMEGPGAAVATGAVDTANPRNKAQAIELFGKDMQDEQSKSRATCLVGSTVAF